MRKKVTVGSGTPPRSKMNWTGGELKKAASKSAVHQTRHFSGIKSRSNENENDLHRTYSGKYSSLLDRVCEPARQKRLDEYEPLAPLVAKLDSLVPRQTQGNQGTCLSHPHVNKNGNEDAEDKGNTTGSKEALGRKQSRSPKRPREGGPLDSASLDSKIAKLLQQPDWVGIRLAQELAGPTLSKLRGGMNYTAGIRDHPHLQPKNKIRRKSPLFKPKSGNRDWSDVEPIRVEVGDKVLTGQLSTHRLEERLRSHHSPSPTPEDIVSDEQSNESPSTSAPRQASDSDKLLETSTADSVSETSLPTRDPKPAPDDEILHKDNKSAMKTADDSANELWKAFVFGDNRPENESRNGRSSSSTQQSTKSPLPKDPCVIQSSFSLNNSSKETPRKISEDAASESAESDFSLDRPSSVANASLAPTVLFSGMKKSFPNNYYRLPR